MCYAYSRPFFEEFLKGICDCVSEDVSIVLAMNTPRIELVSLVYNLIHGKRKIKILGDSKVKCLVHDSSYNSQGKVSYTNMRELGLLKNISNVIHLGRDKIEVLNVTVEDLQHEEENPKVVMCDALKEYDLVEIENPQRDHMYEYLQLLKALRVLLC